MLSGISVTCFTASYAVALVLEVTRLWFRSGIRGVVMLGFAGAGLFAHTVFLYRRASEAVGSPLSSNQDWFLIAAWFLVLVYVYLTYYHPKAAFGIFIFPLVLALVAVATFLADSEPVLRQSASMVWGTIHGLSLLLGTVAVSVGFVAGIMYLTQARRLKHKLPPLRGLRLPSLEWLQGANSRALVTAALMLGVGILSGTVLNMILHGSQLTSLPWTDPFVLSTVAMFTWLLISTCVLVLYRPARTGQRVAFLTLTAFLFLAVALGVGLLVENGHWAPRTDTADESIESAEADPSPRDVVARSTGEGAQL